MSSRQIMIAFPILLVGSIVNAVSADDSARSINLQKQSVWLRQLVRLDQPSKDQVQLLIAGRGACSAYLNGQRLARAIDLADGPFAWDVTELVRAGRNSVALTVDSGKPGQLFVALEGASGKLQSNKWKSLLTAPPIGWQQTDFNDRDWKPAATTVATGDSPFAAGDIQRLDWSPDSGPNRIVDGKLQFREGDHVVMLGGTFIERAQSFGHLEAVLNCSTRATVTFRNLGWSADTVFAESRGIFDSPAKGYERMIEHVRAEEPSVVLVCYGQNAVMDGQWNVERFSGQLKQLCGDLKTTGAQIVLLSPHAFLDVERPYPSPARWNPALRDVSEVIRRVATSEGIHFVDLFNQFVEDISSVETASVRSRLLAQLSETPALRQMEQDAWSDNGMHWNEEGYARVGQVVGARLLVGDSKATKANIDFRESTVDVTNGEVRGVKWGNSGVQFEMRSTDVSAAPISINVRAPDFSGELTLSRKTESGTDVSRLENAPDSLNEAQSMFPSPDYERLRDLTVRKNELYFHRWRPQNITYLFGFRKHEQGNNASEIAQFDPLIAELEKQINAAKQPQWQTISITSQEGR